jgi:hypothetical protein
MHVVYTYEPSGIRKIVQRYFVLENFEKVRREIEHRPRPTHKTIKKWFTAFLSGEGLEKNRRGPGGPGVLSAGRLQQIKKSTKRHPKLGV